MFFWAASWESSSPSSGLRFASVADVAATLHGIRKNPASRGVADFSPRAGEAAGERLGETLSPGELAEIAGQAEDDRIDLHFGLGARLRETFRLWGGNRARLADCLRQWNGDRDERATAIHPDDASLVILRALWRRLRQ